VDLTSINEHLRREEPETLELRSYDARDRRLVLVFTCDGGPREDEALIVRVHGAALLHLPSILHGPVRFRVADAAEARRLIPTKGYDAGEMSGDEGGYTVVLLEDRGGSPYGYYLAAERIDATWEPKVEGRAPR